MPNGNIIVTEERATRVITLRRPGKKNAITQDMYREMSRAIDTAQNNPDIRCMIITGGSGVFTAGDDIDDFLKADTSRPETLSDGVKFLYSLALNVKPIIAAVDGASGLVPVGAASLLMPRTMGYQRAFAMLVMGRTFSAAEAHAAGFVNTVVSPGHTEVEARKVAREICRLPAEAVAISRRLLRAAPEELSRRIDQEGHLFGERLKSDEAVAAFNAFANRKKR